MERASLFERQNKGGRSDRTEVDATYLRVSADIS
jgi:hypothetical protein